MCCVGMAINSRTSAFLADEYALNFILLLGEHYNTCYENTAT